jgi:hypothetical protein
VKSVDAAAHTLTLAADEFFVPADKFDLRAIKPGDQVVVQWEMRGDRRVAVRINHSLAGD